MPIEEEKRREERRIFSAEEDTKEKDKIESERGSIEDLKKSNIWFVSCRISELQPYTSCNVGLSGGYLSFHFELFFFVWSPNYMPDILASLISNGKTFLFIWLAN